MYYNKSRDDASLISMKDKWNLPQPHQKLQRSSCFEMFKESKLNWKPKGRAYYFKLL